jgi:putative flippase GtrA
MNGTAEAGAPVIVYEPPIREGYGKPHHTHQPAVRRGRHRKPQLVRTISSEHGKRLASFSLIGFGVFTVGLVAQVFLVQVVGVPKVEAYIVQLVLSVQVNFLANYHWTWGDRDAPFWRSCWRYNVKRLAGAVLTLCLYPALVHFGVNYLVANALLVAALTPVNYILGHFWTFASSQKASPPR